MTSNEPLIYLIGNYEKAETEPDPVQNHSPMELDRDILPPVPSPTKAYTQKDIEHREDSLHDNPGIYLSSVLNLVAFIEQADKKRKNFYDHGNAAKEALNYKLQILSRDFNNSGKRTGHAISHNIANSRKLVSETITFINHSLYSPHSELNHRINRALENLATAGRNARLDMKRNVKRLKPPAVTFRKKHYAAFASAGALGLTTVFVMQAANSNTPQQQNKEPPSYNEQDFLIAVDNLADITDDNFMLTDEIKALAAKPISPPAPQASKQGPEPSSSPPSINDTAILKIPLADDFRISSRYGMRFHPVKHRKIMHEGIDVAAPTGTPIEAPSTGTVEFAGRKGGYGKTVILDHGNGLKTLYAHLSRINVNRGDQVRKGEVFAKVGATGRVTGAHLHFEIHKDGKHINPSAYVAEQRERREIQIASGLIPPAPSPKQAMR